MRKALLVIFDHDATDDEINAVHEAVWIETGVSAAVRTNAVFELRDPV